ncbi:MAG: uracil-DNA glycosylase [candidate division SR1 bacterium]|nr:uracil-DNA glycosylase [candidate division SR1 bacterium]
MNPDSVNIHPSWKEQLKAEFSSPYFQQIKDFLLSEYQKGFITFPLGKDIFRAFDLTPFDQVKVVILGQDPYHGVGEAHGLSFSVPEGIRIPPSLRNIFKELKSDLGIDPPASGNLQKRAEQGVFLLNAGLTVRKDSPNSHKDAGRHRFTDAVISVLSREKQGLVFILRGAFAQQKISLIDQSKHLIIKSPHPSPFSADRGFFGSRPFSQCNSYLISRGKTPINRDLKSQ